MKNRAIFKYLVLFGIFAVLSIALFVTIILFSVVDIAQGSEFFQALMIILLLFTTVLAIDFIRRYFAQKQFFASLETENSYTLGHKSTFYNFEAFKNRAESLAKKRSLSSRRQFILAFSCTSLRFLSNGTQNEMISSLNYYVSLSLEDIFIRKGENSSKYVVYGYNRGIFLVYLFIEDERKIPELIQLITMNIYRVAKEKSLKVYVQPFFGVKEVVEDENLTGAIEDAFIARSMSENNFETYSFYNPKFKKVSSREDILEIEEALRNNEFLIYYQPKFSVKEKKFISSEALARWNSPKHGFMTPAMFINKAESAGLISLIDNYIFELALKNLSEELRRGRRTLPVSVNFSIYEFYSQGFIDHVLAMLEKYNVPAKYVEIEITETTSQANQFLSISIIKKLKELGIRVLMDDFGIGYSGIDNLRKIPFDAIKIDKTFSDLLVEDEKTRSIVRLITELGHTNGIEVIIEGVDNQRQVDILKKMHIDTIQGYYYARPMPLEDYEEFLKSNQFEKKGEE